MHITLASSFSNLIVKSNIIFVFSIVIAINNKEGCANQQTNPKNYIKITVYQLVPNFNSFPILIELL